MIDILLASNFSNNKLCKYKCFIDYFGDTLTFYRNRKKIKDITFDNTTDIIETIFLDFNLLNGKEDKEIINNFHNERYDRYETAITGDYDKLKKVLIGSSKTENIFNYKFLLFDDEIFIWNLKESLCYDDEYEAFIESLISLFEVIVEEV
jgi:hypothetical protein